MVSNSNYRGNRCVMNDAGHSHAHSHFATEKLPGSETEFSIEFCKIILIDINAGSSNDKAELISSKPVQVSIGDVLHYDIGNDA